MDQRFDHVLFVDADDDVRLHRLMTQRGLSEAEARAMMRAQGSRAEKRRRATSVIENNGSLNALAARVREWLERYGTLPDGAAGSGG
jgi:dephospho-CoA kinase